MSQIEKLYDNDLVSEIALMCNDFGFKDFRKETYAQAIYRSQRKIATKYNILERNISMTVQATEVDDPLYIGLFTTARNPISNFKVEFRVGVNGEEFTKTNTVEWDADDSDLPKEYIIYFDDGSGGQKGWVLDYYGKAEDDEIIIYYTTLGSEAGEDDGNVILPNKYYEEVIRESIIFLSRIGIASFTQEKLAKYTRLMQLNTTNGDNPNLERNDAWIRIKPFQFL